MIIGEFLALVIIVAIVGIVVVVVQRNETKAGQVKRLTRENRDLRILIDTLDRDAYAEYTVTNSPFAGTVLDAIRRHDSKKEIE